MADKSRIRGVRYGAGASSSMSYSNQAFVGNSQEVMYNAIEAAGEYNGSEYESFEEPVYFSTKAGIVEYYKDLYAGKLGRGGWKDTLAKDYADFTGGLVASVKKSLNPERMHQSGGRQSWEAFGKTLPPSAYIPKQRPRKRKRARVSFSCYFKISNSYKTVDQTVYLDSEETQRLMESGDFDAVLESYRLNNIDMLEEMDIGTMTIEMVD